MKKLSKLVCLAALLSFVLVAQPAHAGFGDYVKNLYHKIPTFYKWSIPLIGSVLAFYFLTRCRTKQNVEKKEFTLLLHKYFKDKSQKMILMLGKRPEGKENSEFLPFPTTGINEVVDFLNKKENIDDQNYGANIYDFDGNMQATEQKSITLCHDNNTFHIYQHENHFKANPDHLSFEHILPKNNFNRSHMPAYNSQFVAWVSWNLIEKMKKNTLQELHETSEYIGYKQSPAFSEELWSLFQSKDFKEFMANY